MQEWVLESALNDIAVIRTTFETIDLFSPDDSIVEEMRSIVTEARGNLVTRLRGMLASLPGNLGAGFKRAALRLVTQGYPLGSLDSMMKLDVFWSVAINDSLQNPGEILYIYEFVQNFDLRGLLSLAAPETYALFLADILESAETESNYGSRTVFDCQVSQKYIAFLFANYAGTDPFFYG